MIICAWDVGIKNLAYCLMERGENNFTILEWEIINLSPDSNTKLCTYRDKKKCTKKAVYSSGSNYYCSVHYKLQIDNINNLFYKKKEGKCYVCNKTASYCYNNSESSFVCASHKKEITNEKINELNLNKIKNNEQSMYSKSVNLYNELEKRKKIENSDIILIENQPSGINPIMKTISVLIYGYYVNQSRIGKTNIKDVRFISATTKLNISSEYEEYIKKCNKCRHIGKYIDGDNNYVCEKHKDGDNSMEYIKNCEYNDCKSIATLKHTDDSLDKIVHVCKKHKNKIGGSNNYKKRKMLSQELCISLLDNKWKDKLNEYKKKDDLCDAFLYCYNFKK